MASIIRLSQFDGSPLFAPTSSPSKSTDMKFFFEIIFIAFVALATAEETVKKIKVEALPVNEAESTMNVRNRRSLLLSAPYTAPVIAAPVAAAPFTAAAAAPVAVAAPVAYSYSASVPYPYAGYSAYASYSPAVYL